MNRERLGVVASAFLSFALAAGCHKSGSTGAGAGAGGGTAAPDVPTACAKLAAAQCARLGACQPLALSVEDGDAATCAARGATQCEALQALPGEHVTAAEIEACAVAYPAVTCDELLRGELPAACAAKGLLDTGSPCFVDGQCTTGRCAHNPELPYGACGACAVEAPAGGPCGTATTVCAGGLFCGSDKLCHAFGQVGDPCDGMTTFCEAPLACTAGACAAATLLGEGAACNPMMSACNPLLGLACSASTMQCVPIPVATAGSSCLPDATSMVPTVCEDSAACVAGMNGTAQCVAAPAEGAACTVDDATRTSNCQIPMLCLDGLCTYVPQCP